MGLLIVCLQCVCSKPIVIHLGIALKILTCTHACTLNFYVRLITMFWNNTGTSHYKFKYFSSMFVLLPFHPKEGITIVLHMQLWLRFTVVKTVRVPPRSLLLGQYTHCQAIVLAADGWQLRHSPESCCQQDSAFPAGRLPTPPLRAGWTAVSTW